MDQIYDGSTNTSEERISSKDYDLKNFRLDLDHGVLKEHVVEMGARWPSFMRFRLGDSLIFTDACDRVYQDNVTDIALGKEFATISGKHFELQCDHSEIIQATWNNDCCHVLNIYLRQIQRHGCPPYIVPWRCS